MNERWAIRVRLGVCVLVVAYAMSVLIEQLYQVQVAEGERYVQRLRKQTSVPVRLSPARGEILDCHGLAIAENRSSFDIDLYLDELTRNYSRDHHGSLPRVTIIRQRRGKTYKIRQVDIVKIVREYLEPIAQSLGFDLELNEHDLREHYRTSKEIPYPFKVDVDFETVAQFSERNLGIPGIDIVARPIRKYPYGAFAPHILGYIGRPKIFKEHLAEDGYPYEFIGRQGIEKKMDPHLQGSPGSRILRVNYRGYVEGREEVKRPTVGNSVQLTLDARIQYLTERALQNHRVGRGAAVVVDVQNGDILALASAPNFDPNLFIPRIDLQKWKQIEKDPAKPLLNRAIKGYPPGSTYKVMIALAALKSNTIEPTTRIFSPGIVYIAGWPFRDWNPNGQGNITLYDGIRMSCNTFFYQVGVRTGIRHIADMGRLLGFGQKTGAALDAEFPGIMPDPDWMKEHHPRERWTSATTANVSIGQGYVLVTPLQMALMTAAIANGGTVYRARLLDRVTTVEGETQIEIPQGRVLNEIGVELDDLEAVRRAMLAVVENGTARRAQGTGFAVAGKTGTAQAWTSVQGRRQQDNKAWFICFAPFEDPKYALCIMVEGGRGGGVNAAPIAQEILKGIHALENGENLEMSYLTSVRGHFRGASPPSTSSSSSSSSSSSAPPTRTSVRSDEEDTGGGSSSFQRELRQRPSIMMNRGR